MSTRRAVLAIALLLGAYAVTASWSIDQPGVNYDELIHVNAALGGVDDSTFIHRQWGGVTTWLMPYVGALKAYLTAPVFDAFGVSAASVRLAHVVMTVLALALLAWAATRMFGPGLACLCLALVVVDPSFVMQTRLDYGFVVLGFAAKASALLGLAALLASGRPAHLLTIFVSLALGLFNKLDFIWFVNGFLAGAGLLFGKDLWALAGAGSPRRRRGLLAATLTGVVLLYAGFLAVAWRSLSAAADMSESGGRSLRVGEVFDDLFHQLNGELFFNHCYGVFHTGLGRVVSIVSLVVLGAGLVLTLLDRGRKLPAWRQALLVFFVLVTTLAQITVTPNAEMAWHLFTTFPMIALALAWSLHTIHAVSPARLSGTVAGALGLAVASLLAYQLATYAHYLRTFDEPMENLLWTSRIDELIEYTQAEPSKFVSVDWGTHTQLLTFTGERDKYFNLCFALDLPLTDESRDLLYRRFIKPRLGYRFIAHPEHRSALPQARQNLYELAASRDCAVEVEHQIFDGERVVYDVLRVVRPPPGK